MLRLNTEDFYHINMRVVFFAVFVFSMAAFSQSLPLAAPVVPEADGVYQLRYLANLNVGDSYVNFTNAGTYNGFDPAGRICCNFYTFDPNEELISCCACI